MRARRARPWTRDRCRERNGSSSGVGDLRRRLVGFCLAVPVSLVAAAAIAHSVHASGTVQAFRRRIDVTFAVLGAATAALAVGWISLRALVGPWPALTMLATVVVGLLIVRPRLYRLAPAPAG